jgi:hypothetical protein
MPVKLPEPEAGTAAQPVPKSADDVDPVAVPVAAVDGDAAAEVLPAAALFEPLELHAARPALNATAANAAAYLRVEIDMGVPTPDGMGVSGGFATANRS